MCYDDKTKEACAEAHGNKEEKAIGFMQALSIPVSFGLFSVLTHMNEKMCLFTKL